MSTRWARFARGWITASFSVLVAALSHVAAGGSAPGLLGTVVALGLGGMVSVLLAGRSLSMVRLALSVAVSQAVFHALFSTVGASTVGASTIGTNTGHQHGSALAIIPVDAAATAHTGSHSDAAMWLAHALAAVLTLVALRWGEVAFWGLVELAATSIRLAFADSPTPTPVPTRAGLTRIAVAYRLAHTVLTDVLGRGHYRGPPQLLLPQ